MKEFAADREKLPAFLRGKDPGKWIHQACRDVWGVAAAAIRAWRNFTAAVTATRTAFSPSRDSDPRPSFLLSAIHRETVEETGQKRRGNKRYTGRAWFAEPR